MCWEAVVYQIKVKIIERSWNCRNNAEWCIKSAIHRLEMSNILINVLYLKHQFVYALYQNIITTSTFKRILIASCREEDAIRPQAWKTICLKIQECCAWSLIKLRCWFLIFLMIPLACSCKLAVIGVRCCGQPFKLPHLY